MVKSGHVLVTNKTVQILVDILCHCRGTALISLDFLLHWTVFGIKANIKIYVGLLEFVVSCSLIHPDHFVIIDQKELRSFSDDGLVVSLLH